MIAESGPRHTLMHIYIRALQIILGIIFIYAGIGKIISPKDFAVIIDNYRILPFIFVKPFAIVLPWVEVTSGACLVLGSFVRGGLLIIDILTAVFILAYIINLIRGIDVACGCFSLAVMEKKSTYYYMARDLLLLGAGVWLLSFEMKNNAPLSPRAI
jgi:putative oxidoreductase